MCVRNIEISIQKYTLYHREKPVFSHKYYEIIDPKYTECTPTIHTLCTVISISLFLFKLVSTLTNDKIFIYVLNKAQIP